MRSSSDSDDGVPLSARITNNRSATNGKSSLRRGDDDSGSDSDSMPLSKLSVDPRAKRANDSSDSESDQPLSNKVKAPKKTTNGSTATTTAVKRAKREIVSPKDAKKAKMAPTLKAASATAAIDKKPRIKKDTATPAANAASRRGSGAPLASKIASRKPSIKAESSVTAPSQDGSEDSDNEEFKWWLENKDNDGPKWKSLEHFGVLFPPEYEPHRIPLSYKGKPFKMHSEVEEVATFFAALVGTDHGNNKVFQDNFFSDFKELCDKHHAKHPIKEFKSCDFSSIRAHLDGQSAKRKAMTKDEKETSKKEKMLIDEKYGFCMLDGRREKVGNFRIEPPALFRGRGAHPKTGMLKKRVLPEQWGNVIHDTTVTWLAMWKENINGNTKYVFLAAGSSLKGQSDMKKFDKARNLVRCIDGIRSQYTKDLRSDIMAERQRATALYLIDRFALRAGNEKSDDEADTVGCCSLRCEHVTLEAPNIVNFDFLGKDSIRYERTTEVDKQVWKNLRLFQKAPKTKNDMLFDRLTPTTLNKHLQTLMPGLTAKVFRTFNASFVFQNQLANTPANGTEAEKILAYNRANREVAVLCNHQRTVSKGFQGQMTKIEDKLLAVRYQRKLLKSYLLEVAPDLKKKHPEIAKSEPGLTAKWIKSFLLVTCETDCDKARKKFERDNEKLKEAGEAAIPESKLAAQIAEINEREKSIKNGTYTPELPVSKNTHTDKILEKISKLTERIANIEVDKIEKDENKTTALSTSKINYIDPRISVTWCKKYNVPLEKIFNKALREKFTWALDVDSTWSF
ncbi:putative DNA topoisomerase [Kickxella alabastrina]|uniref:putative DNA topoisomerase n=1 Tax=Kickxella alabastrina TaxID=61397 RepID=UPI00221FF04E|nr:putative DNA topoisomerase [Kickxella alabastrina]KAI7826439.1 putative DNA topoisomerase [Kickxella alabastrina]